MSGGAEEWVGKHFGAMQTFRKWTFGRYTKLRQPQPADLPEDRLLPMHATWRWC